MMIKLNKYKGFKGFFRKMKENGDLERTKVLLAALSIVLLIAIGQSLAFDDEVAQHESNCSVATYAADNKGCSL